MTNPSSWQAKLSERMRSASPGWQFKARGDSAVARHLRETAVRHPVLGGFLYGAYFTAMILPVAALLASPALVFGIPELFTVGTVAAALLGGVTFGVGMYSHYTSVGEREGK